jgi:hypothetical protein
MEQKILKEVTDLNSLDRYLKSSGMKFREAILRYYKELGEKLGYTVRENASIIKNGVNYGKIDMIWLEPNIVFINEFGNLEEIYKHLWKVLEYMPNDAVFLLSSKSSCKAEDVDKIVEKSSLVGEKKNIFLIMDVTDKKVVRKPSIP